MTKKILSIVLIFMITFMLTIDLYKQESNAVAPAVALVPAATLAIYYGLASAGLLGETSQDHAYVVNDYIGKITDYEKAQWNTIAKYGLVVGSMVINGILSDSLVDYAKDNYTTGDNITLGTESVTGAYQDVYDNSNISFGSDNYTVEFVGRYAKIYNNGDYVTQVYCNRLYETGKPYHLWYQTWDRGTILNIYYWTSEPHNVTDMRYGINTGSVMFNLSSSIMTATGCTYKPNYNVTGDGDGIGLALSNAGKVMLSLPTMASLQKELSQIEADQALADWIEAEMNKVNKTNKPNWGGPGGAAAAIAALAATSYYWLDPVMKTITQTTTQTPPPGEDLVPLPAPGTQTIPLAPSLPDNYPTEDNPEIKTKLNDPIITTIDNGDGTHTETKTQDITTTERYYDPDSGRWISTDRKERTTTTTDIDDATGTRTQTGQDTVTLPDGNTTSTPPIQDATEIDWQPLKQSLGNLTNKFPFSLPWDLYNTFVQFIDDEWDGKIKVRINSPISYLPVDWKFDLDFSMFDDIRKIAKQCELICFDLGLIFVTRKLMGGGV